MLERPSLPRFIKPAMPQLVDAPPTGTGWIHEIKHGGYRTQLAIGGGQARAYTRRGHDWSKEYVQIIAAVDRLTFSSVSIRGELVAQDERCLRNVAGAAHCRSSVSLSGSLKP
ncbi:MAG TPA: hypothetical protein VGN80_05700 [Devosiaceae bacterium]|jgi:ATP-dependent DNA ligase|nr:hypothetical protein [Devosiaceae bacterium]